MGALVSGLESLNSQSAELVEAVDQLSGGAGELSSGAASLASGTDTLSSGAATLSDGAKTLFEGTLSADEGAKKLASAAQQLVEGAGTLADGINTLDEEGISKIVDLMGNKADALYDRLQAIIDYAQDEDVYTGVCDKVDYSVTYIFKTAGNSDSEE